MVDASRIALYPTGRLYLYRFSPEIPFRPSPPGSQASKQLHSGASHSSPATLPGVAASLSMGELYAPGAALSTPCKHTPPIRRHTVASRTRARDNHRGQSHAAASGQPTAIRDKLRMASHSHLTVFDNALYRETILKKCTFQTLDPMLNVTTHFLNRSESMT